MPLGAPLLISGENKTSLSPCPMNVGSQHLYTEDFIQKLIDSRPDILPIHDLLPGARDLYSLGREIRVDVGGRYGGAKDGLIDNLLVTDDGHWVVVETKLWRNPESVREVVAQTLQYGMAVSELSPHAFEERLRRSHHKGTRLAEGDTVAQHIRNLPRDKSSGALADDFEESCDRFRVAGEILLVIVADRIQPSAERFVEWMNKEVGSAPYKLGLVELCLYDLPEGGQIVIPRTLLRTREASRHVVTIDVRGALREQLTATVTSPNEGPKQRKVTPPGTPLTQEALEQQVRAKNPADIVSLVEELISQLKSTGMATRGLPATFQYGIEVDGDFVPLLSLMAEGIWFQIPVRAVRILGEERFVECKQRINSVASFYRPEEVSDPTKTNALNPRYGILEGKVASFISALEEIAESVKSAFG
jgi:hypothetical protein